MFAQKSFMQNNLCLHFTFYNIMIRIAILDLYNGQANQGMRCLRQIIKEWSTAHHLVIQLDEFEVRRFKQVPDLSYDIYISSGGPGSPFESEYMPQLDKVAAYNKLLIAYDQLSAFADPSIKITENEFSL